MSHYKLWQQLYKDGVEAALILEDDAIVHQHLPSALEAAVALKVPFDVLRLGGINETVYPKNFTVETVENFSVVRVYRGPTGSFAYIVSRAGLEKLIARAMPIRRALDAWLDFPWLANLLTLDLYPYACRHNPDFPSNLGRPQSGDYKKKLSAWHRVRVKMFRESVNLRRKLCYYQQRWQLRRRGTS